MAGQPIIVLIQHSFASRAPAIGEDLPMVGKLLGHRKVITAACYALLAEDSAVRVADSVAADILPRYPEL